MSQHFHVCSSPTLAPASEKLSPRYRAETKTQEGATGVLSTPSIFPSSVLLSPGPQIPFLPAAHHGQSHHLGPTLWAAAQWPPNPTGCGSFPLSFKDHLEHHSRPPCALSLISH